MTSRPSIVLVLNEYQLVYAMTAIDKNVNPTIWLLQDTYIESLLKASTSFKTSDSILVADFRSLTNWIVFLKAFVKSGLWLSKPHSASYQFFTSYSDGLHFVYICKLFGLKWKNIVLFDDGLNTWIPIKTNHLRSKRLVYSVLNISYYKPQEYSLALDSRITMILTIFPRTIFSLRSEGLRIVDVSSWFRQYLLEKNRNFDYIHDDSFVKNGVYLASDRIGYSKITENQEIRFLQTTLFDKSQKYGLQFKLKAKYSNPMGLKLDLIFGKDLIEEKRGIEFLLGEHRILVISSYLNTTLFLIKRFKLPISIDLDERIITKQDHVLKLDLFYNCPDFELI